MRKMRIFGREKLWKQQKFLLLNGKTTIFESFLYTLVFFEYRLKNIWNHFKNLLRITRLEENFVILIKKTVDALFLTVWSRLHVTDQGHPCMTPTWRSSLAFFLRITWKIKYQINIYIVSWMIWIFKTQITTALILLYTMK